MGVPIFILRMVPVGGNSHTIYNYLNKCLFTFESGCAIINTEIKEAVRT